MSDGVRYEVRLADPAAHLFEVELSFAAPRAGQRLLLPAWIPGSYMIREFARNIVCIEAFCDDQAVGLSKLDKHCWQLGELPAEAALLRVVYRVYAWDLSVRCAHLDNSHAFFNGTQLFLRVEGREQQAHRVLLRRPAIGRNWSVATALAPARGAGAAKLRGFGWYEAADYDELIDHPVEMGDLTWAHFNVRGVEHDFAIHGRHDCDMPRLAADLQRVCEAQCALFGDEAPPFSRYVFLLAVVGEGYGGLEHRASTALLASRNDLPYLGMAATNEAYRTFLGLCSHEYFHAWNVKRIKPAAFIPYNLQEENYTRLLWLFEGFTSYYDDLALLRAGLISRDEYFALLARGLSAVQRGGGRLLQSVAESSFDTWIKYYRQDENAPNAIVSYYAKGALVALALDAELRRRSPRGASLDDFMRLLWQRFGRTGLGVPEEGVAALLREVGGIDMRRLLNQACAATEDLPYGEILRALGLSLSWEAESETPDLGAKLGAEGELIKLQQVLNGGPAHQAGLSAGDLLLAVNGLRVKPGTLDKLLQRQQPGAVLRLHVFRRDELFETQLCLTQAPTKRAVIKLDARAGRAQQARREAWLKPL